MLVVFLILLFALFIIYELYCIHVPKNFEAPLTYRVNVVLTKVVTLIVSFLNFEI